MFYADSYYFMRLAEVYYIAAEAEARQGQYAKARTLLATVIERAGYTEDDVNAIADSDLLGEILKHKLCDMSNEILKNGSIFAVTNVRVVSRVGQKMRKQNFLASADIFFLYQRHLWEPIIFWFRIRNM